MPQLSDHDPAKWDYTEHTRAKHSILERYLGAWLSILGNAPSLIILDGFAGRGVYNNGEPGSPRIIFDRAAGAISRGITSKVTLLCGETDPENLNKLKKVMGEVANEKIDVRIRECAFAESGEIVAGWLEKRRKPVPTFVFADPYGFSGIPLRVMSALLSHERVEVLLTFMARDMGRFLELPSNEVSLTETFGGETWVRCADAEERASALLLEYQRVVRPDIARWATPFRVSSDERNETLYYLVHLTNHPLGMRRMKEAMVAQSPDMTFWPITIRPPDQLALDVGEQEPFPALQTELVERYSGRELSFVELLNDHYPEGVWVEPKYRKALLSLEGRSIRILRDRSTPSGRAPRGLKLSDTILFEAP